MQAKMPTCVSEYKEDERSDDARYVLKKTFS